jgi:uncharacterized spore protein YtfJ
MATKRKDELEKGVEAAEREAEQINTAFTHLLDRLTETIIAGAKADTAFGSVTERDGVSAIPVARVVAGLGVGMGSGGGKHEKPEIGAGSGGGGGGGFIVSPLGTLEVRDEGVSYVALEQPGLLQRVAAVPLRLAKRFVFGRKATRESPL